VSMRALGEFLGPVDDPIAALDVRLEREPASTLTRALERRRCRHRCEWSWRTSLVGIDPSSSDR